MNGADSSDDENGVLYFLPGGIADDSPPRRTLEMSSPVPSSFGSIGPAQSSTTTSQQFRMSPGAASEPNNFLLSGLGGVAVPNTQSTRDRTLGGGGFGTFGGYGYGGRLGGPPGGSSTPTNSGGIGSIGSSSFLGSTSNAGASSQSATAFSRSPFMNPQSTSSSTGPLRAPPGLGVTPPSAAPSFRPPQQHLVEGSDDSLQFGFLPQHSSAMHPPLHPVQHPAARSGATMFSSAGYPQQSNMDLAELNTTSVVIGQQPSPSMARHFMEGQPAKDNTNSIGVHRFRNTFLDPQPEDVPSQLPPAPLRSSGAARPSTSRSIGHTAEPALESARPSSKTKDVHAGKRHGSPSSVSSLESDVSQAPSGVTPSSPMNFAGRASANVSSQPPRVVPGQIRIKQRGDGMSPKKPVAAVDETTPATGAPARERNVPPASRGNSSAATSTSNRRQASVYREKYPKAISTSADAAPPTAGPTARSSTPRRNGRSADKPSPRVAHGGGSAGPPDVTRSQSTPRSTASKHATPSAVQPPPVVASPQRANLSRRNSPMVSEPAASSEDDGVPGVALAEDSTDEDVVSSQDGAGDVATPSAHAPKTPPSDKASDNDGGSRDGAASDEDASVDEGIPASSPSTDPSPPPSPKRSTAPVVPPTKEQSLHRAPSDDLPSLDAMATDVPLSQDDNASDKQDNVPETTPPTPRQPPQDMQPPSSEDDMPARPATAASSSKKRSDKRNRRAAASASENATSAVSAGTAKAHGPLDKKKSDGGLKSTHKKQDVGKDDNSTDGSAAHAPPQRPLADDDDLFAPVPRSAWSEVTSALVAACVWVVAATGASTGLPWLLVHVHWALSTLLTVIFHAGFLALSYGLKFHRFVVRGLVFNRNIASCFAFLYLFPLLVQYVIPWAPPWAPVCLWYAFLVQLFCTQGSTAMVATFRILLPLVFLVEGVSHHSFLLDLNGAELLLISFILSAVKTGNLYSPVFFLSLSLQCLSAVFLGSEMFVQWIQLAIALYSLHAMASDDWGDLDDGGSSVSFPHASPFLGDVPHPSGTSIQKTKRLDRRSMAAVVKGRKPRAASST